MGLFSVNGTRRAVNISWDHRGHAMVKGELKHRQTAKFVWYTRQIEFASQSYVVRHLEHLHSPPPPQTAASASNFESVWGGGGADAEFRMGAMVSQPRPPKRRPKAQHGPNK
jgi:hypothetical protein